MNEKLLEPIKYYDTVGKATHQKNAEEYFDRLVTQSTINAEENRKTVKEYKAELEAVSVIEKKIKKKKTARVFLIILPV